MFTIEQLKQLSDFLIHEFKEVFATKEDVQDLKEEIREIRTHVDNLAGLGKNNEDEITIMGNRVSHVEHWVVKAAPKIGLKYKT